MQFDNDIKAVDALHQSYNNIKAEIGKVVIGQDDIIKSVLISIFSNGHCLLVGVPGLAKTLLVQTVANVLDLNFNRIQFTPDLMPSDIIGAEILGEDRNFKFINGPVFSNIILADEINRTPPKTQAALLEAMQEKAVTAAGLRHVLPNPFFVLATQNPIEQEGTYPLPEAQLDRFMFNVHLSYPSFADELTIVKNTTSNNEVSLNKIINASQIQFFQKLIRNIPVTDNVVEYAVKLVSKTRPGTSLSTEEVNKYINWGAGPRASQFLVIGAKCHAAISGKYAPDIEDVQAVAEAILRHRIVRNYRAEAEGLSVEHIIKNLY
ncbi:MULTISPECIES: AAA family ATPase [Pedobacter]|uniref:ATPase associated with various cellular activities AAA_3 n=1 Tax=Pedobacter heparinus (strain ATCC 13125 / DSM 2366 / CIP 104194 / JCM 7457 / NBRC 12017 / NCIMB 9290 / NRRL B-14731 / HIM 762-3) TaxID=485917 RepID=C6Y017_PEDHD|nr:MULTISPECIES: MoxR family ATPase [Pedobacter]ACU02712.1 ATPase associated with various cellular activities AAA_3 [Pedobacter heparinus DSM 2366]MBB5438037.1 MoxR-like ATPase [Pedobacter sp. AK017]